MALKHHSSGQSDDHFVVELTKHQLDLKCFIRSLMPGYGADVPDILQETNLITWQKRSEFIPGTNFKAWAFAIARNKVLQHMQKTNRRSTLLQKADLTDLLIEKSSSSTESMELKSKALEHCLSKLSKKNREIVRARYEQGDSLAQHSTRTKRSESSLRVTLHRIRNSLRKCIESRMPQEFKP